MNFWQSLRTRFRWLFQKDKLDQELDDELRFHLELQEKEFTRDGMSREEARYEAMRALGGVEQVKERCRETRSIPWLETTWEDLQSGVRLLTNHRQFTIMVVLMLGLGIGATTAILSMLNKVVLNPVPGNDSQRLVSIKEVSRTGQWHDPSLAVFTDIRKLTNVFEVSTVSRNFHLIMRDRNVAETLYGFRTTPEFFQLLGARPLLGRVYRPSDKGSRTNRVLVISHEYWQRRYGSDPEVLQKTIIIAGQHYKIIGVMPSRFQFPAGAGFCQMWMRHDVSSKDFKKWPRTTRGWGIVARLRPGVSLNQAQLLLDNLSDRNADIFPRAHEGFHTRALPLRFHFMTETIHKGMVALSVAIPILLILACANVAILLLVRSEARRKEMSVRIALGASRFRIFRQLLTENLLILLLSSILGLLIAWGGIHFINAYMPYSLSRLREVGLDWNLFGLVALISICVGLGFGFAPARQVSRIAFNDTLKEAGSSQSGSVHQKFFLQTLVIGEVSLAVILLVATGLMVKSVQNLLRVDLGFNPKGLLYVHFKSPKVKSQDADLRRAWSGMVADHLRSLPGVKSVGLFKGQPELSFTVEDQTNPINLKFIGIGVGSNDYFRTLRVPLLAGRLLTEADNAINQEAIVVNKELVDRCWPNQNPLGKRIIRTGSQSAEKLQVVGVVGNIRHWRVNPTFSETPGAKGSVGRITRWRTDQPPEPAIYVPMTRHRDRGFAFLVRTMQNPILLTEPIEKYCRKILPREPLPLFIFLESEFFATTRPHRTLLYCLIMFGAISLVLATFGLYGVLSYSVTRRTKGLGIQMALGLTQHGLLRMVVRQGACLVGIGLVVGLTGAFWITQLLNRFLFQVSAVEPIVVISVALVTSLVALAASLLSVRRVTNMDLLAALRHE